MVALSLVSLAILKSCPSSKAGETRLKSSVLASLGSVTDSRLIDEMQDLFEAGLVIGMFSPTKVQRTKKGEAEIAKLNTLAFAKQVDMRILAQVPEKASKESIELEFLAGCLGVLGIGRKSVQDLISAGYLELVEKDRLRRTENGDLEYKKKGKPFQRKR